MSEKKCIAKNTMTTSLLSEMYKGATKASYFVTDNRDFSANDVKQFELLLSASNTQK
ncbi:hypothetical protein [Halodesulfovibrio marinisediminis]|uniref:Uncharacterized protein n=1 Tax=Halodesulfovibrio marinisediminis DSM 17456 TaxID=1121457 RepID=A0A1N6E1J0_9BACT|nr:hypothetical protein [Halodesulfovibrio marinisediminis]SIN76861.1 hypothetical protein SAMN02745161_0638 [Halodesulfovibrio marinisediminis DSM 17456]